MDGVGEVDGVGCEDAADGGWALGEPVGPRADDPGGLEDDGLSPGTLVSGVRDDCDVLHGLPDDDAHPPDCAGEPPGVATTGSNVRVGPGEGGPGRQPPSATFAAASPLRTAPSIVAGQSVSVHAPASASPGSSVAGPGRNARVPGVWRNVAVRSRVTNTSIASASRAAGSSRRISSTKMLRISPAGRSIHSSAADREIARYCPPARAGCSPTDPAIPLDAVRSKTHCTGDPTTARKGPLSTGRS